jgi:hypothetical protein
MPLPAGIREITVRGEDAVEWLQATAPLDGNAAKNLVAYVREQEAATGAAPTDRVLTLLLFHLPREVML